MNLATLRSRVGGFLGDPDDTRFSPTVKLAALNDAQTQFALETRALWKDASWSHAANDADENLPSDFMWEEFVTWDGYELSPITREELNRLNPGTDWTDDTATSPTHYIIDPEEAVKEIVLYPIPTEAKTLRLRYFPLPTALASDSDVPLNSSALMVQFHLGIAAYAAWLILLQEEQTPSIVQKQKSMLAIYNDAVTKAVDTFRNTASAPIRPRGSFNWR